MKRFFGVSAILGVALVASALLAGCFGGSDQVVRYYTISLPAVKADSANAMFPYRVLVKRATIDPAYRRSNIVYRESAYDFMFYNYSVWAARPEYLVEQSFVSYLKQKNVFAVVETEASAQPDYEISINVNAVEEIDEENARKAHLAVTINLKKMNSDGFVWSKEYDNAKPYEGEDVRTFAQTISEILNDFVADAVAQIVVSVK